MTASLTQEELAGRLAALRQSSPGGATASTPEEARTSEPRVHAGAAPAASTTDGARGIVADGHRSSAVASGSMDPSRTPPVGHLEQDRHRARRLVDVASTLLEALANTEGRWMTGLNDIDIWTRGVGPGELAFLTGRSYSGKTNLFINSIHNAPGRPVVIFTMDEPAEHVLAKLYTLETGEDFETVERLVKAKDSYTMNKIRQVAAKLDNVVVFDDIYTIEGMSKGLEQARGIFKGEPAVVFIDYLGLIKGDAEEDGFASIENKARMLKQWTQVNNVPVICVHQGTRTGSGKGKALTLDSMAYAGENEAFHVFGVRRKRDEEALDTWERERLHDTVSVSVIKSKRLPMRRGERDYYLDPITGGMRELTDQDMRQAVTHVEEEDGADVPCAPADRLW